MITAYKNLKEDERAVQAKQRTVVSRRSLKSVKTEWAAQIKKV